MFNNDFTERRDEKFQYSAEDDYLALYSNNTMYVYKFIYEFDAYIYIGHKYNLDEYEDLNECAKTIVDNEPVKLILQFESYLPETKGN